MTRTSRMPAFPRAPTSSGRCPRGWTRVGSTNGCRARTGVMTCPNGWRRVSPATRTRGVTCARSPVSTSIRTARPTSSGIFTPCTPQPGIPCTAPVLLCIWTQICGQGCYCGPPPGTTLAPVSRRVIRFCPKGWRVVSRGCQAPRGTRVCPGNWRVTGTSPLVCGRASTAGQNFAPTPAAPTTPTVWATGFPTKNLFVTTGSTPSASSNVVCPVGFDVFQNNCRANVGITTCPMGATAATSWRQVKASSATHGVTCAMGIQPASASTPPAAVPTGPTTDITFTTVVSGITVAQFKALGGVATYTVALSVLLQLPPSNIVVKVVGQSRALQAGAAGGGSVSLSAVVTVPKSGAAVATAALASSSVKVTALLQARGGAFTDVSAQSATMQGSPTMTPTAVPTMSPRPTIAPTFAPSAVPSLVPTLFPTFTLPPPTMNPTSPAGALSSKQADGGAKGGLSTAAMAGIGGGVAIVVLAALYLFLRSQKKDNLNHGTGEYIEEVYGRRSHESNNNFVPHVGGGRLSQGRRSGGSFSGTSPVHDKGARLSISRSSVGNRGSIGGAHDLGQPEPSNRMSQGRASMGAGPSPSRPKFGPPPGQVRLSFSKQGRPAYEYQL